MNILGVFAPWRETKNLKEAIFGEQRHESARITISNMMNDNAQTTIAS